MAEKVVEECVLHETDCCMHDAVAHLNLDIFTVYAEVELAYAQCVILMIDFGIFIPKTEATSMPFLEHLQSC